MQEELTYGEVVESRITSAIDVYEGEIAGVLTSIELNDGDVLENRILSGQLFTRDDISIEKLRYLSERTISINKAIADISK